MIFIINHFKNKILYHDPKYTKTIKVKSKYNFLNQFYLKGYFS